MELEEVFRQIDGEQGVRAAARYLAGGGDINAICPGIGWTLLHVAAEHRNPALIRTLAKRGADLNAQDGEGWTPLHVAVDSDIEAVWQRSGYVHEIDFRTALLLASLGASRSLRAADGRTSRDVAARYGAPTLRRYDELLG